MEAPQVTVSFDYEAMVQRNIGFVTRQEQVALKGGRVFVCGAGGMGGACLQSLVRAGVGGFEIADFDHFEISNLNRQVFASLQDIGNSKVETTQNKLLGINPELDLKVYDHRWIERLDEILTRCKVVVNGMDDVAASIILYRKAKEYRAVVIDAYTSPLPSVICVRPNDPRPEVRLGFPSIGLSVGDLTPEVIEKCKIKEIEYVMVHSSSAEAIDLKVAGEMMRGERARMSFAPMVIMTGNLMAFEVISLLLGRPSEVDCRGYFYNARTCRIEKPRSFVTAIPRRFLTKKFFEKVMHAG